MEAYKTIDEKKQERLSNVTSAACANQDTASESTVSFFSGGLVPPSVVLCPSVTIKKASTKTNAAIYQSLQTLEILLIHMRRLLVTSPSFAFMGIQFRLLETDGGNRRGDTPPRHPGRRFHPIGHSARNAIFSIELLL
jgi:hypothetical protein